MIEFYTCPMSLRIRALRIQKGLSQQLLAEKANISRSQLSEIETETKPANTLRLTAIAKALGVDVEDLFETDARDQYINELKELMLDVPAEDRHAILQLARSLSLRRRI